MSSDPAIAQLRNVDMRASTAAGDAYVRKAFHPPGPTPADYQGIPDCSAPQQVRLEVKGEASFPPILTYNAGTVVAPIMTTINPSSMLLIRPSGAYVGAYVFLRADGGWVQQTALNFPASPATPVTTPALISSGYNFLDNFSADVATARLEYKSLTTYLNATEFNNQGMATTAKFKPDILTTDVLGFASTLTGKHRENFLRAVRMSQPSRDFDDFQVISSEGKHKRNRLEDAPYDYPIQLINFGSRNSAKITDLFGNQIISGVFPDNAGDVMVSSSKSYNAPAKDGTFDVAQQTDAIVSWTNTPCQPKESPYAGLVACYAQWYDKSTQAMQFVPLWSSFPTTSSELGFKNLDTPWYGHDWSFTLYEGLTVPSSPVSINSGLPYLTLKSITGFAFQTFNGSSQQPHLRSLPYADPEAIRALNALFHERPDALPAKANDLGTIAALAAQHLPSAIKFLVGLFNKKKTEAPPAKTISAKSSPKIVRNHVAKQDKRDATIAKLQRDMLNMRMANTNRRKTIPLKKKSNKKATTMPTPPPYPYRTRN
jgi:hypothetical protein